ncbi:hypothetical protein BD408DRAFT_417327 [Parasitella parasitica]|nr:hypothetical protein BD408DRAFT_417327 [Parasitella parasitica]
MSDNENNSGSPIDRSKRPRFQDEEWDSDYERDGHEDRHPKRLAVLDPETKAPHFIPSSDDTNINIKDSPEKSSRRKKWEEHDSEEEIDDKVRLESSSSPSDGQSSNNRQQQQEDPAETIPIRSLVGTKDAGVIIGRGGKNVSDIRESSNARVTISDIIPGAYERILTVTGPIAAVAKAYALVGEKIISEHAQPEESNAFGDQTIVIKLLVPDSKMGTLIGKGGVVIKAIQDDSGARLNASEEPLPMSTERTVSVQGTPSAVEQAVSRIAKILLEHSDRPSSNFVQYRPIAMHHGGRGNGSNGGSNYVNVNMNMRSGAAAAAAAAMGYGGMMPMGSMPMGNTGQFYYGGGPGGSGSPTIGGYGGMPTSRQQDYGMGAIGGMANMGAMGAMGNISGVPGLAGASQAQQIFIPNEMVGCIIGKGGSKINEIRQLSGSHIKIADPHGDTNERLVTVTGTPESNQMALYLLYSRLESEKNRMGLRQ